MSDAAQPTGLTARASPWVLAHGRGELRVFLGAAPGVGKTYAMLREGHRLVDDGHDVVVGYIESHGRAETEAQIGDLEAIPRQAIAYHHVTLLEMDTEAILRRKPEIVLIDELAHTNARGSTRAKRYEDVEYLRDHGIDVITTVNIQHLDSLHDIIAGITGVDVRELVPDWVLEGATDVQLVDLSPELLRERLARGKIYPGERAQRALDQFFEEGNLTALRELALRQTAAGVNERLAGFMLGEGDDGFQVASERVVVLVDADRRWGTVLRHAWRVASAIHAELVVLETGGSGPPLAHHELADDLGARWTTLADGSLDATICAALERERATILVVGYRPRGRWRRFAGPDLIETVMRQCAAVDCYLVRLDADPSANPNA